MRRVLPSLKKSTVLTGAVCPLMTFGLILLPGYHSRTVLSYDELAMTCALGAKATQVTFLVCPSRVRFLFGLAMFHNDR